MRWFEVLAAALFTLDMTGSGLAVAVVSAARTLPMLLLGAFAGVMSEAVDRKRVLLIGQIMSRPIASATDRGARRLRRRATWHVGACRTARRHRLVHRDVHPPAHGRRSRVAGRPGSARAGARYGDQLHHAADRTDRRRSAPTRSIGLAGAYAISAGVYLIAVILVAGLAYQQASRRIAPSDVPRDLAEAFAFARGHVIIGGVLAVTIAMNLLGFCYSALVAPIARQVFMVSPTADRHAGRRRGIRRVARRFVADRRRSAPERAHADGRRFAAVPGVRDPDAVCADVLAGLRCCWSSAASVPRRSPTCRPR